MKEWFTLQKEALQVLRSGYPNSFKEILKWDRKYQIIKEPSFENPISWEIFECNESPIICVRSEWDKLHDSQIFQSPIERLKHLGKINPSITYEKKDLGSDIDKLLKQFSTISLPVCSCDRMLGLDGVTYELIVNEGMTKVSFQCWEGSSGNWKDLDKYVQEIIESIESP